MQAMRPHVTSDVATRWSAVMATQHAATSSGSECLTATLSEALTWETAPPPLPLGSTMRSVQLGPGGFSDAATLPVVGGGSATARARRPRAPSSAGPALPAVLRAVPLPVAVLAVPAQVRGPAPWMQGQLLTQGLGYWTTPGAATADRLACRV